MRPGSGGALKSRKGKVSAGRYVAVPEIGMNLKSASALVVGGASGIGEASARCLAEAGARCVILDRDHDKAKCVASRIGCAICHCRCRQ